MTDAARIWEAWNALPDWCPNPVTTIAGDLGLPAATVAATVFPAENFGAWADDQEPTVDQVAADLDAAAEAMNDGWTPGVYLVTGPDGMRVMVHTLDGFVILTAEAAFNLAHQLHETADMI